MNDGFNKNARDILVIGSLAYDTVKTPSGLAERALGGSANYFSVAASFFSKVNVVGVVGEDYSQSDRDVLLSRGVNLEGMQTAKGLTFHWAGYYEGDMSEAKTVQTDLNVFGTFNPQIPQNFKKSEFVFLANIDPVLQLQVLSQVERPVLVGMDSMNYWISSKKEDLLKTISKVFQINNETFKEVAAEVVGQMYEAISILKTESFRAFLNPESTKYQEIDQIKAQFKDSEGILDIDKLGAYLKTKPKALAKYCDF